MKRVFLMASVGLMVVGLTGCSRGWPSLFCNGWNNDCCEVIEADECCNSGAYYAPSNPTIQYAPAPARSRVDELPMPGPDRSNT